MRQRDIAHGDELRLPYWSDIVLIVEDIGVISFWGRVVEVKSRKVIDQMYIASYCDGWEKIKPAKDVIKRLKIKNK